MESLNIKKKVDNIEHWRIHYRSYSIQGQTHQYGGISKTFGDIDGKQFAYKFSENTSKRPFLRLLATHAFLALENAIKHKWIEDDEKIRQINQSAYELAALSSSESSVPIRMFSKI